MPEVERGKAARSSAPEYDMICELYQENYMTQTMKRTGHRPLRKRVGSVYLDFGFTKAEVFKCDFCGIAERDVLTSTGSTLACYSVPITPRCPIAGLVGVCMSCFDWLKEGAPNGESYNVLRPNVFNGEPYRVRYSRTEKKRWIPPPMAQPIPRVPIYLLTRNFCNETRLRNCLCKTWQQIPNTHQKPMRKHWMEPEYRDSGFCKGGLRVEALLNWPGRKNWLGQCLNKGHAIRLHAPSVDAMPDTVLMALIAHELGHTYQWAAHLLEGRPRPRGKEKVEKDVHAIMQDWGFRQEDIYKWWDHRDEERWQAKMAKDAREEVARARARTSTVLKCFADHCQEAQLSSKTKSYKSAACELAMHLTDFEDERTRLNDLCNAHNDESIWQWFQDHYPDFMKLVPTRSKRTFLNGIYQAHKEEIIF